MVGVAPSHMRCSVNFSSRRDRAGATVREQVKPKRMDAGSLASPIMCQALFDAIRKPARVEAVLERSAA
jgi:hypothetical protein